MGGVERDLLELTRRESQPQSIVLDLDNVYAVIICKTKCTKYVVNIHPKSGCPSDIESPIVVSIMFENMHSEF